MDKLFDCYLIIFFRQHSWSLSFWLEHHHSISCLSFLNHYWLVPLHFLGCARNFSSKQFTKLMSVFHEDMRINDVKAIVFELCCLCVSHSKMIRNICEELPSLICPLSLYPVREQHNWITIAYQNSFKLYSFHIINHFICLALYNLEEMTVFKSTHTRNLWKFKFTLPHWYSLYKCC